MTPEQEPTLGEILRGQAAMRSELKEFKEAVEKRDHAFRNAINASNVTVALHGQQLKTLPALVAKVDGVTATANKIAGAWALACLVFTAIVAWVKR